MDQAELERRLAGLPLGPIRYFDTISSTNDEAASWAEDGAPDLSLVVADEQTAGRGRSNRRWYTPAGSALAFSLVLRPSERPGENVIPFHTVLGALAVSDALEEALELQPEIKWPNDVLVGGRKLSGVLSEAYWQGERPVAIILGIGVNVGLASCPPPESLTFPATCLQAEAGTRVDRWAVLRAVLGSLIRRRDSFGSASFLQDWEARLAYLGEGVSISQGEGGEITGRILGLTSKGGLRVQNRAGEIIEVMTGDVRLRPVHTPLD